MSNHDVQSSTKKNLKRFLLKDNDYISKKTFNKSNQLLSTKSILDRKKSINYHTNHIKYLFKRNEKNERSLNTSYSYRHKFIYNTAQSTPRNIKVKNYELNSNNQMKSVEKLNKKKIAKKKKENFTKRNNRTVDKIYNEKP